MVEEKLLKNILQTKNVIGGYGSSTIIHGIDLEVGKNEIVCILGPNGSGKSTLIKIVYGLATYHSGEIYYDSPDLGLIDIAGFKANQLVRQGISYVPQRENIFPGMTVEENLEMGGYLLNKKDMTKVKIKLFKQYPILAERKNLFAKTLSGGQRQILAMARALMISPHLIILDEPTAALQPNLVADILVEIQKLRDNHNVSVLLVEQNVKSALQISDRAYVLSAGKAVFKGGSVKELEQNENLAELYLGATS